MKQLAAYSHQLGDQGSAQALAAVDGGDLVVEVKASYRQPIAPIVEKVMGPVDDLIDKLEALIPGDQKALAAGAKADVRAAIVKALSEEQAPQIAAQDAIDQSPSV